MYIQSDKCEANQMDSTNAIASANASARLSEEVCTNTPALTASTNAPGESQIAAPISAKIAAPVPSDQQVFVAPRAPHHTHHFFGLNIGVLKIGFKDHSLAFGLNVAVAKLNAQLGRENHVDAGVNLGLIGARAGAGLGVNHNGIHSDVGGRFHLAKLVDTGAELKAKLGPQSSVHADTGAKILFAHTRHTFDSNAGEEGFNNGYRGDLGLGQVATVQVAGHANLNDDSSLGAQVKTNLQDASIAAGTDIDSQSNTLIRPDVHVEANSGAERARLDAGAQVGPTLDLRAGTAYDTTAIDNSQHSGQLSVGVGQSGIGVQATDNRDGRQTVARAGWGPDYMADF